MKKISLAIVALLFSATLAHAEITSQFTSGVENREPVDTLETANKGEIKKIVFYTVLKDMNGQKVFHVWKNADKEIYRQTINVGSQRWRVWSSVVADHYKMGDTALVEVQDEAGKVLDSKSIKVTGMLEIDEVEVLENDETGEVLVEETITEVEVE